MAHAKKKLSNLLGSRLWIAQPAIKTRRRMAVVAAASGHDAARASSSSGMLASMAWRIHS